ncbi:5-methylthioadenosine/S-adenosylhomocysteine deaminase [Evansella caseinilytica]|uniref:5-methylthioadenosine/S-adenosylhomocysteine deaminase n=1 Tax=Evansella caseinilytica TaxID=1503961 RepID=A0A1H3NHS3_9BACI|nr:amidohydrolase [Evansella caseinilytica]SDY88378.1 5-methylthioadenosine/S-adenosylhomocysteine deaminase [Evansella caseinilytica]
MVTIIHSVTIVTLDENDSVFDGYVVIKDGELDKLKEGKPAEQILDAAEEVIDGKGKWLLPGLINTHGHIGSSFLRGAGDDMPLLEWLQTVMWPNEKTFDEDIVRSAASLAMVEMIKSGTTTFLDMYHLYMDKIAELVAESHMRAVLCRGMIGNCPPDEQMEKLLEAVQLHKNFHGYNNGKVTVALSPHAPYTCPPEFLEKVVEQALLNQMWIHIHVAETKEEVLRHEQQYGIRPVEHLQQLGLFRVPCMIAHGVHVNEEEMQILADNHVYVSHNPKSNLKLGSGIAPLTAMWEKGINVALGTDSTASNNTLDLFEELRFAALIHKGVLEDPTATTASAVLKMATVAGAKALQLNSTGALVKGNQADFIMLNPKKAHLSPWNISRVASHLVYAAKSSDVTDVFVQGRPLMKNGELQYLDEEKIIFEANMYLH